MFSSAVNCLHFDAIFSSLLSNAELAIIDVCVLQVFSHAKVYFSVGGRHFTGEPVHFSYMPDLVMEHARNVTVKLHQRLGRFIKLQLYFASRWILLSEITFESGKHSNKTPDYRIYFIIRWDVNLNIEYNLQATFVSLKISSIGYLLCIPRTIPPHFQYSCY